MKKVIKFSNVKTMVKKLIDLGEYELAKDIIEKLDILSKYPNDDYNEVLGASSILVDMAIEIIEEYGVK